jgi:hypothetical protein
MKATTTTTKFPSTAKLFAFIVLVSGLAFLSCMVSNAQVSNESAFTAYLNEVNDSYADVLKSSVELSGINMDQVWAARLDRALVAETEASLEVESWMLNAEFTTEITEERLEIEDWMLDTEYFMGTEADEDPVELEDWMLE